jgi:hypothetical protein
MRRRRDTMDKEQSKYSRGELWAVLVAGLVVIRLDRPHRQRMEGAAHQPSFPLRGIIEDGTENTVYRDLFNRFIMPAVETKTAPGESRRTEGETLDSLEGD